MVEAVERTLSELYEGWSSLPADPVGYHFAVGATFRSRCDESSPGGLSHRIMTNPPDAPELARILTEIEEKLGRG